MRDADDPVEAEVVEAVANELGRAFGREALSPGFGQQPVADLDLDRLRNVLEREPADVRAGVAARRAPGAEPRIKAVDAPNALHDAAICARVESLPSPMYLITRGSWSRRQIVVEIVRDEFAQLEAQRLEPGRRCFMRFARQRGELLGLMLLRERVDQLVEVAVHDRVDLVERQVDPVIGHAALRKIVGADALAAVARSDQALAIDASFAGAPSLLVEQPRRQHRHRLRAVAVLRAVVLAFDDEPRRQMRDAHRGVGLVDVLAAGARRAEGVDAEVGRIDGDVGDRVGFGHHRDGARRRVDAPLRLGLRHALHAVAARLELELRVGALADDAHDHFLVAAELGRRRRHDLDLPALRSA